MIGIPVGLFAANAGEWAFHKYILHGLARDKRSFWAFHWHEHHRNCRKNDNYDPDYYGRLLAKWNGQSKEAAMLALGAVSFTPLLPVAPFFVGTLWYSLLNYYVKHKRAHKDVEWCREHLPWHYDHHMGPNQHANWCVTRPWFDILVGTRQPYANTEREQADIAKREAKRARKQQRQHQRAAAG